MRHTYRPLTLKESFLGKAKWRRKETRYELIAKISEQCAKYHDGRNFYSNALFFYEDREIQTTWNSFLLPSHLYNDIIYDVYIKTCQYEMSESKYWKISNDVHAECRAYPEDEMWTEPSPDNDKKLKKDRTYISRHRDVPIDMYDGRTRFEEIERRNKQWYEENKNSYQIHECVLLHTNSTSDGCYDVYAPLHQRKNRYMLSKRAVFVNAVLDIPVITFSTIMNFIANFYAHGEKAYIATDPIPQNHLIYKPDWLEELNACNAIPIESDTNLNNLV